MDADGLLKKSSKPTLCDVLHQQIMNERSQDQGPRVQYPRLLANFSTTWVPKWERSLAEKVLALEQYCILCDLC